MLKKSQSCDKCFRTKGALLTNDQVLPKTIKKPQSYLSKKFDDLYKEDSRLRNKKKQKIDETLKKKQQEQLQICTFKPQINNNPEYYVSNDPFLEREVNWKKALDRKIQEKREQLIKKQSDVFTFQPKILGNAGSAHPNKNANNLNYSSKNRIGDKKSYKVIHTQNKKYKQITKTVTIQPFSHRKNNINQKMSSSKLQMGSHSMKQVKYHEQSNGTERNVKTMKNLMKQQSFNNKNNDKHKVEQSQNKNNNQVINNEQTSISNIKQKSNNNEQAHKEENQVHKQIEANENNEQFILDNNIQNENHNQEHNQHHNGDGQEQDLF